MMLGLACLICIGCIILWFFFINSYDSILHTFVHLLVIYCLGWQTYFIYLSFKSLKKHSTNKICENSILDICLSHEHRCFSHLSLYHHHTLVYNLHITQNMNYSSSISFLILTYHQFTKIIHWFGEKEK